MFVAAGLARHGEFEEARPWELLHSFEPTLADQHYLSAHERVILDTVKRKNSLTNIVLTTLFLLCGLKHVEFSVIKQREPKFSALGTPSLSTASFRASSETFSGSPIDRKRMRHTTIGRSGRQLQFLDRRLRCGFSVVLRREQHDLAVEIKRQAGIPPRTWTPSSLRFFIQSLLRRSRFVFLPSCRHCRLYMKIAGRGGTAFSLFPFRSPTQHGLSKLPDPYRSARRATRHVFFFELQGKKCGLPNFCARSNRLGNRGVCR